MYAKYNNSNHTPYVELLNISKSAYVITNIPHTFKEGGKHDQ